MKPILTLLGMILFCLNICMAQELRFSTISNLKYEIEFSSNIESSVQANPIIFPLGKRINPPLTKFQPNFNRYSVDTEKPKTIKVASGTSISIPTNAFLDENGFPVKGKVDLFYKELNSAQAILLSGIPMDSKEGQLQSAAMFEIRATLNGEAVFPNPNAPIEILFPATPIGPDFSFYNYDEEKGEWTNEGAEPLMDPPLSPKTVWQSIGSGFNRNVQSFPYLTGMSLDVLTKKDDRYKGKEKGLQIKIRASKRSKSWNHLSFQELNKLNSINWVYAGDQSRSNLKEVRSRLNSLRIRGYSIRTINDEGRAKNVVGDCWFTLDYEADCFLLNVSTLVDTLQVPVVPFTRSGEYQEQKQLKKLFLKYESRLAERKKDWQEKLEKFYEITEAEIAKNKADFIQKLSADQEGDIDLKKPRQVRVMTFGICNIDRVVPMMSEEIFVECANKKGEKLKIKSITICNEDIRTVLDFPDQNIQIPSFEKNSMLIKFEDGRIVNVNEADFRLGLNKENKTASYTVNPVVKESIKDVYNDFLTFN